MYTYIHTHVYTYIIIFIHVYMHLMRTACNDCDTWRHLSDAAKSTPYIYILYINLYIIYKYYIKCREVSQS